MPKIKNIIIFIAIGAVLVLGYLFFIKPSSGGAPSLATTNPTGSASGTVDGTSTDANSSIASNFLTLLLSVNNIKLDDTILSSKEFAGLHDSSIVLVPDTTTGRPNPFSPIGTDVVATPPPVTTTTTTTNTTTPATTTGSTTGTTTTPNPKTGATTTGTTGDAAKTTTTTTSTGAPKTN